MRRPNCWLTLKDIENLRRHYDADSDGMLIQRMLEHIESLQDKLSKLRPLEPAFRKVREG